MSGHSKWSKVKHQKEGVDAARGKLFTKLAIAITMAVRQGGGSDPASNFRLRLAMEKARAANMPKEKIHHAIGRGEGSGGGGSLEEILYEGFGPGGVGILIAVATDNRQRAATMVKSTLEMNGGVFAASGAVSHIFLRVGRLTVLSDAVPYEDVFTAAAESGATDVEEGNGEYTIFTEPEALHEVKHAVSNRGISITAAELSYRPTVKIQVTNESDSQKLADLLTFLEALEDVQEVFINVG